jgi:hypothetical protein
MKSRQPVRLPVFGCAVLVAKIIVEMSGRKDAKSIAISVPNHPAHDVSPSVNCTTTARWEADLFHTAPESNEVVHSGV